MICRRIDISEPLLPILNATTHRPYVTYDDAELRWLVTDFYRRDLELRDYPSRFPTRRNASASRK